MQQPSDIKTIAFRVNALEQQVQAMQSQLSLYVPVKENDLRLQLIKDVVERIELEIQDSKVTIAKMSNEVTSKLESQGKSIEAQRESQDKLQIRALWILVSTLLSIFVAIFVSYATHLLH